MIPTFAAVDGSAGVNIQNIKISNATDWNDSIQVLDEGGSTVATYIYVSKAQSGFEADGWAAEDFSGLANVTFEPGQSLLIDTADAAVITFSGQVSTADTVVETVAGFNFIGNNSPVAIDIQDIVITGGTDWNDSIQILDEGGSTVATYIYVSKAQSGFAADGWAAEDFSGLADVDLEPGLGVLVDTADVATITIPGVDL